MTFNRLAIRSGVGPANDKRHDPDFDPFDPFMTNKVSAPALGMSFVYFLAPSFEVATAAGKECKAMSYRALRRALTLLDEHAQYLLGPVYITTLPLSGNRVPGDATA